jgi:CheY-like chemotaxis protein
MPYGRVLVVDDVEANLYVAKGFLMPYKLMIETVESGMAAIQKIKDGNIYDIIFMDHMMPEMDGIETTKEIRAMGYTLPIIALTANAFRDMAKMFKNNGFTGYASKPIEIKQLDKYLMHYIRDKQPVEVVENARQERADLNAGREKGLSEILTASFMRSAKKSLSVLESLDLSNPNESDIKAFTIQVHAVKNVLSNIACDELSLAAKNLELAGRKADIEKIKQTVPEFLEKLKETINHLAPEADEEDISDEHNTDFLRSRMALIYDACEFYDIDSANDALIELQKTAFSKKIKALINEITDLLLDGNFDNAGEMAKKITRGTLR